MSLALCCPEFKDMIQVQVDLKSSIDSPRLEMDIAEVAKVSGLPASTLRYYEEKGLIESNGRNGLRRLFSPKVLEQLDLISLGRGAGFSLDEIGEMFTNDVPEIDRTRLLAKANELDKKIKELTAMRNGLRHAAVCPEPSHFECPKFLRLLRLAGKNRFRQRNKRRAAQRQTKPGARFVVTSSPG